ncbi:DUF4192 family protein [Microbacterium sp. NPDC055683]
MTTIIRARDARSFLSLLPHVCGYRPRRSLLVVPFEDGRTAGAARIDLPERPEQWPEAVAVALGMMCRLRDVTQFAAVVYTDEPLVGADGMAFAGLVEALRERADHCGLEVRDALCVAADGWGAYADGRPTPRPLEEIAHEGAVPGGDDVLPDQGAGIAPPAVDLAERERLGRAHLELGRALAVIVGDDHPGTSAIGAASSRGIPPRALATACFAADLPVVFEECLEWDTDDLDPYLAALLVWALERPCFRDVALSQWSSDLQEGWDVLDLNERWADGDDSLPDGPLRLKGEGPRPDPDRLERALALVQRLAASAPGRSRAGALASAAWLMWALGHGTHALAYARQALAVDDQHGLAQLVGAMASHGMLPEWAFERPGAA